MLAVTKVLKGVAQPYWKKNCETNCRDLRRTEGPFIFYEVGGAGGIGGGSPPQKNGLKGGASQKKTEGSVWGGGSREIF